jgi:hypothetical protein
MHSVLLLTKPNNSLQVHVCVGAGCRHDVCDDGGWHVPKQNTSVVAGLIRPNLDSSAQIVSNVCIISLCST